MAETGLEVMIWDTENVRDECPENSEAEFWKQDGPK